MVVCVVRVVLVVCAVRTVLVVGEGVVVTVGRVVTTGGCEPVVPVITAALSCLVSAQFFSRVPNL